LAFQRASGHNRSYGRLRAAIADFPPDEQQRLWAEVDKKFAELREAC